MNKFIKSTLILIIGGFVTKMLGMIIKIVITRLLGPDNLGIYMLTMPTFGLFIALAQLGFPTAISKIVSENKRNNANLLFSIFPISLLINGIILLFLLFTSRYISNNLLHEPKTYYTILSIGFVLPFISISSILRGYFFGKQKMIPHVLSNILEDIIRLISLIIGIPIFMKYNVEFAISYVLLTNIFSEISSIIIFIFLLPKKISLKNIKPNLKNVYDVLSISLPSTASRIVGSIGYFLEPIILTYTLLKVGFKNSYIVYEYGIINGYVLPLLLLPTFFTSAISQALLPIISKSYSDKNYDYTKKKINQAILFSLIVGIPATLTFMFIPGLPLNIIYNTNEGINYIRILAPIFILLYIQSPLVTSLNAMNKSKDALLSTTIGMFIRTLSLYIFSLLKFGLYSLLIATSLNIIFTTILDIIKVKKAFKKSS